MFDVDPEIKTIPPGPRARKTLNKDATYISPSYTRVYPLVIDRASGISVWDVDGNKYLDFTSGVAVNNLGHCHPEILKAVDEQLRRFIHMTGSDFYNDIMVKLAEKLCQITPGKSPKKVFFCNSGTEAVEAAVKLARYSTGRTRMIAFLGGFHGRTFGSLSLTASKAVHRERFSPLLPDVTHVPYAYCYRCVFNLKPESCAMACVKYIEDWIFTKVAPPRDIACIVVEPIQGEGGYIVPPQGFFKALRELCDKHKILLVMDEIQTGMGRTGKMFAIEHWGVIPDIICVSKSLASGLPIGAMIARADLHTWGTGAHANTFAGSPVSCAAALKTIELIQNGLVKNAAQMGKVLGDKLKTIASACSFIGEHRGSGLMQAVEIVTDKKSRKPAIDLRDIIVKCCFENGLLILPCGDNSLRFIPPLTVEDTHIEVAVDIFESVLRKARR